jgi:spermidine synthase
VNGQKTIQPAGFLRPRGILPLLLLLFTGSGCAALVYEIVWFQLLQFVIGSTAVSLAVLLGTYMLGLCLGSILLPRIIPADRNPLRTYAWLETAIGIFGVIVLYAIPCVGRLYVATAGHGFAGILISGALCALCLLPPTLCMGATLPAISRCVESTQQGVSWLGFLYSGNIVGAVFGCLSAGFYLLRVYDMPTATYVAVVINGMIALIGFGLAPRISFRPESQTLKNKVEDAPGSSWIYLSIALSGFCALGAEVIWTRLLSLLLGPTVYTFSIVLAVFLVGLGIGSGIGSLVARTAARPRIVLGVCQMLLMAAVAWTAYMLARSLPYWPVVPVISRSPWFNFQIDLVRCSWAILPATILWGASFPLALASVASRGQDLGFLVGKVYAANTLGAIIGAIATSIFLIGWLGTQGSQQVLVGASAMAAFLAFAPSYGLVTSYASGLTSRFARVLLFCGVIGFGALLIGKLPRIPWQLIADGRSVALEDRVHVHDRQVLCVGEGINASVAVTETGDGARTLHVNGRIEASTDLQDMRLQRMLGHIPALLHHHPRSVLVVGCGAGITAGSFVLYPEVKKIVICEIERMMPEIVVPFFSKENYDVIKDPRVQVVYDDARHYIFTTKEKFDVITSDPVIPWTKGTAGLYTKEYFELCRQHLNPGGVVAQWLPLYENDSSGIKSALATFFEVFPNSTIWSNRERREGNDIVFTGSADPMRINVDEMQQRLDRNSAVTQSLRDVGFGSAIGLLATYTAQGPDLGPWLKQAEINRDWNLKLQYLAGMASYLQEDGIIYNDLLSYQRYPENLFNGSDQNTRMLKEILNETKSKNSP